MGEVEHANGRLSVGEVSRFGYRELLSGLQKSSTDGLFDCKRRSYREMNLIHSFRIVHVHCLSHHVCKLNRRELSSIDILIKKHIISA